MLKVEVARGFFSRSVSAVPAEGMSKNMYFSAMDKEYPCADGWEVLNTHAVGVGGNSIGLAVFLVQYKYVAEPVVSLRGNVS